MTDSTPQDHAPVPTAPAPAATTAADAAANAPAPRFCAECGAPLSASARFCQRCGTAVAGAGASALESDQGLDLGVDAPLVTRGRGPLTALPWIVAAVGLVGGAAYVSATERNAPAAPAGGAPAGMVAPFANGGGGTPPDIASMSPNERANRLYGRIMAFVQAGKADSAAFFAPMALAAHEMLDSPTLDERYHLGQINEMLGNAPVAAAQADTILKAEPENLLGLMLATHAAQLANKAVDVKRYNAAFLKALDTQLATKKPEYEMHRAEIDRTAAEAKGGK